MLFAAGRDACRHPSPILSEYRLTLHIKGPSGTPRSVSPSPENSRIACAPADFPWRRAALLIAATALHQVQTESWIVQLIDDRPLRRIAVAPDKVRTAADHFIADPRPQSPHESWRRMINEMTGP